MLAGRRRDPGLLTITVTVGVGVGVAVAVAAAGEPGNVAISGGSWYNRVTSPPQPGTGPSPGVLLVGDAVSGPGTGYLRQLQRLLSPGLATVQFAAAPAGAESEKKKGGGGSVVRQNQLPNGVLKEGGAQGCFTLGSKCIGGDAIWNERPFTPGL